VKYLLIASLLAVAGLPALGESPDPAASVFLVARPKLPDPNFSDTVVLITQFGAAGAMGVIVNRPTSYPLASAFPEIKRLERSGDKVWFGGPVAQGTMVFLVRAESPPKEGVEVLEGVYLSASVDLLRDLLGRDKSAESVRVFSGYAGWSPGQLESEIARGDWNWFKAEARSIFERKPESLWPELNRRASATTVRADPRQVPSRSGVQLDHVAVGQGMLGAHVLAVEARMAPEARIAQ
jgi:putative transcriptional regulator